MQTPDITPIQKLVALGAGVIPALIAVVNAFGIYDVTAEQSGAILGLYTVLGSFTVLADAIIRNGRSRALINPPKPVEDTELKA